MSLKIEEIENIYLKYPHYRQIKNFIETGTYMGNTCVNLSSMYNVLYTVDNNEDLYYLNIDKYKSISNIHFYVDTSISFLNTLLPNIKEENTIFFLDAHSYGDIHTPLIEEIELITHYISNSNSLNIFILNDVRLWNNFNDWSEVTKENILHIFVTHNINILDHYEYNDKYIILTY